MSLISCEATKVTKTPAEVKMMTTKKFETGKDLVFKSVISLLQSESFLVEQTDKGLTQSGYYNSGYGVRPYTKNKESMIYDPIIYDQWFNNLLAEIERRRALTQ